jgi:hypothetical protein
MSSAKIPLSLDSIFFLTAAIFVFGLAIYFYPVVRYHWHQHRRRVYQKRASRRAMRRT